MKAFTDFTYSDATALFGKDRISHVAKTAREFYKGNHWQDGKGFLGQLAPQWFDKSHERNAEIRAGFISQNACKRVVNRHLNGVFDREPQWSLVSGTDQAGQPVKQKEEALTRWWDDREILLTLGEAVKTSLIENISILRIIIPRGRLENKQIPQQKDLAAALDYIYLENLTADKGGVFTNPDTQRQVGVYLFEELDEDGNVTDSGAELSFLDDAGLTVWKIVRDRGQAEEFGPYDLGGRLLVYEIRLDTLLTEQVQSLQKGINLNHSMMLRNVNIAGARERNVTNAQHPRAKRKVADPTSPSGVKEITEQGVYVTGGGAVNYLMGFPIFNADGKVAGYTNPTVSITDPSDVTSFLKTHEHYYTSLLDEVDQLHFLMASDATANGVSRIQARADYERSLKPTKHATDAAGRWVIETPLRLAAQLAKQSDKFLQLRAEFNAIINTGPVDPQVRQENRADYQAGLLSKETTQSWNGVEDTGAENERIAKEAPPIPTQQQPILDKTGSSLPAA